MEKKENNLSTNIEAKNRLLGGILGAIPGALISGIGGAILSIGAGIFGAKLSLDEADRAQMEFENDPKRTHLAYMKKHYEYNDEFSVMQTEHCEEYLEKIRQEYPMEKEFTYWINGCFPSLDCNMYRCYVAKDESTSSFAMAIIYNDLVREIEDAKAKGAKITWTKMNVEIEKMSGVKKEIRYIYSINDKARIPVRESKAMDLMFYYESEGRG